MQILHWIGYKNRAGEKMDEWCYPGIQEHGTNKKLQFDDFHTESNQEIDLNASSYKYKLSVILFWFSEKL